MPVDANVSLGGTSVMTSVAITFPGYNTITGTPRRGLAARALYTGLTAATNGYSWTIKQQMSADNTTYIDSVYGVPISFGVTTSTVPAGAGVSDLHVYAPKAYPWIRFVASVSPTTGTPSGTLAIQLDSAIPG